MVGIKAMRSGKSFCDFRPFFESFLSNLLKFGPNIGQIWAIFNSSTVIFDINRRNTGKVEIPGKSKGLKFPANEWP